MGEITLAEIAKDIGEIKGIVSHMKDSHTNQIATLFEKNHDLEVNGTTKCRENEAEIEKHSLRLTKLEKFMIKATVVAASIFGGYVGIDKLIGFLK